MPAAVIEAIRTGAAPRFTARDEALVHRICSELFRNQRLSNDTFTEAIVTLKEKGLVEVIAIIGYYTLIANTLNAFAVDLPKGTPLPFPE